MSGYLRAGGKTNLAFAEALKDIYDEVFADRRAEHARILQELLPLYAFTPLKSPERAPLDHAELYAELAELEDRLLVARQTRHDTPKAEAA